MLGERGRSRLLEEATDRGRIPGEVRQDHLDRVAFAEERVLRLVDGAHPARPEETQDGRAPKGAAQHWIGFHVVGHERCAACGWR
jgi:hypothetical protein